jgi:hypothetical protein
MDDFSAIRLDRSGDRVDIGHCDRALEAVDRLRRRIEFALALKVIGVDRKVRKSVCHCCKRPERRQSVHTLIGACHSKAHSEALSTASENDAQFLLNE